MQKKHPAIHTDIHKLTPTLKKLALHIHAHPELAFREDDAARRQIALLKSWKFRVEAPFAKLPTAFKAVFGRGRPTLCLMSEYDALPQLGHGCGHNLIAISALAAGRALAGAMRQEKIPGTLVVMGTPGEEAQGGKVRMIRAGALKGIDAAIMAHPSWRTTPDTGSTAVCRYNVIFHGKAAHAAGSPELGRNALDAVMLLFQGVNAWRQQLPETCRVHGIVTNGGAAPNIIPDLASCYFYLRSTESEVPAAMGRRFAAIAKGAALMTGTRLELQPVSVPYRARRPNRALNEAYRHYARAQGLNPVDPARPGRGSSDFGDVSQTVPGAHVYFGIARREIAAHSTEFLEAARSDYGISQALRAAETLANVGYRYLADKSFRDEVAREFRETCLPRR